MKYLKGYANFTELYESQSSLLFRCIRTSDQKSVVIKLLKDEHPTPEKITGYRQEYEITKNLNINGVIKVFDLHKRKRKLIIVLEDFGGDSLANIIKTKKFTLKEFFHYAVRITNVLGEIHRNNVVHRDINPSNIIVNAETDELKIIDFGISTTFSRETPILKNPEALEGTLAYISPEQTGRMNRSLDYRTDFYSLGACFYEMLTGRLPFLAEDAMEMVHCHIALQPTKPRELDLKIPTVVSNIILKLMEKTPEERYQSSRGIVADLGECLRQLEQNGRIEEFDLCREDRTEYFSIPGTLYGRNAQVQNLLQAFKRVGDGGKELLLLSGYAGIGKSAIVHEIHKPITQKRASFISGKFDQFQRNIPYNAIVIALRDLIKQLLSSNEDSLKMWRNRLLGALGPNGQIIIDVIPELELIVGPQPVVQELGTVATQNRFNVAFQNFIQIFCRAEHPLCIFLDDLQWADLASLNLIELMMNTSELKYLFLIGAYRDNEVDHAHPLMVTLSTLQRNEAELDIVPLPPLETEHITQLIADTLHSAKEKVKPLAELVHRKTSGNPFFVNQFLQTLYSDKLLVFDFKSGEWLWKLSQIEERNITENVVDLMVHKLRSQPVETQKVLKMAACVGNVFELKDLAVICEKTEGEVYSALKPAIQEGFLLPASNFSIMDADQPDSDLLFHRCRFLHDRVQQAAYALMNVEQKKEVHLQIGRLLLRNTSQNDLDEKIFDLATHLNVGRELITADEEKEMLARFNLEAGKKAKLSTAYSAAIEYLTAGMSCLFGDIWKEHYGLTFELYKEWAEAEYLKGNFKQADENFHLLLERAAHNYDRAEIYLIMITQLVQLGKFVEAIDTATTALKLFGHELPDTSDPRTVESALKNYMGEYRENLENRAVAELLDLPEIENRDISCIITILVNITECCYIANPPLCPHVVLTIVNLSIQYGCNNVSSHGFVWFAVLSILRFNDFREGYKLGQLGLKLNERFNNIRLNAKMAFIYHVHISHWTEHIRSIPMYYRKVFQTAIETGELVHGGYTRTALTKTLLRNGMPLDRVIEENKKSIIFLKRTGSPYFYVEKFFELLLLNLRGLRDGNCSFESDDVHEQEIITTWQNSHFGHGIAHYVNFKMQNLYLFECYEESWEQSVLHSDWVRTVESMYEHTVFIFYQSLTGAALYEEGDEDEREYIMGILQRNVSLFKLWGHTIPENFLDRYLMIKAEIARINGDGWRAAELYGHAIEAAHDSEFIQNEALANELAAKFWLANGNSKFASIHMMDAHYAYRLWGAKRKVEYMEERYGDLLSTPTTSIQGRVDLLRSTTGGGPDSMGVNSNLDLISIMKASRMISGEIAMDKLLTGILQIVLENAGARQGALILKQEENFRVMAQGSPDEITVLQSTPLEESEAVSCAVVHYAARTEENVVLRNALLDTRFIQDDYIKMRRPKSVLCVPILLQRRLIGLMYLENDLTADAFTKERIEVLNMLTAQIAISIENAELYAGLEEKVRERTFELKTALDNVQELKERQDGDYYRTSLLVQPLGCNTVRSDTVKVSFFLKQNKKFEYRNKTHEIGGDVNIAHSITLRGNPYTIFLNSDAMGKSSQGAGGVLVLGSVFESIMERVRSSNSTQQEETPELWLRKTLIALHRVFESFGGFMLMSILLGAVEDRTGLLYFVNADHPLLALYRGGKAKYVECEEVYWKLGMMGRTLDQDAIFVQKFQMEPGDVIFAGSDGRSDIMLNTGDGEEWGYNDDETMFLSCVEGGKGELENIYQEIMARGEIMDDLSLLRLAYRPDSV